MASGVKCRLGVAGVCVGIGGDGDGVRFGDPEGFFVVRKFGVMASEFGIEFRAGFGGARDDTDDFETLDLVVGESVGAAHVTGADAENADSGGHSATYKSKRDGWGVGILKRGAFAACRFLGIWRSVLPSGNDPALPFLTLCFPCPPRPLHLPYPRLLFVPARSGVCSDGGAACFSFAGCF